MLLGKPKGPVGMTFVPLPAPIALTLPPPHQVEPLAEQSRALQEELAAAAQERRREQTDAGEVLNRVVYDAQVFVPGGTDRVPGGALLFESRFESGNLRRAVHVNGNEYDLLLNWDHGTRGHTQWYYFSVCGAHAGEKYTFNIVNFCKPQSLYKNGMRPLIYSAQAASKHGHGWMRAGTDVIYYENGVSRRDKARAHASPHPWRAAPPSRVRPSPAPSRPSACARRGPPSPRRPERRESFLPPRPSPLPPPYPRPACACRPPPGLTTSFPPSPPSPPSLLSPPPPTSAHHSPMHSHGS